MKIAVMGTGGVGGYFGGLLARKGGHQVTFVARGAHLAAIKAKGLRVESQLDGDFTAPGTATDDPASAGIQDLVLFTVKMYHNAQAIEAVRPMVGPDTVVFDNTVTRLKDARAGRWEGPARASWHQKTFFKPSGQNTPA